MKKRYLAIGVIAVVLFAVYLSGTRFSTPPLAIYVSHDSNQNFVVEALNNSDSTLYDIEFSFSRYPYSTSPKKKITVLKVGPNESVKITESDLGNWHISDPTMLTFGARGYLFPNSTFVSDDPRVHKLSIQPTPAFARPSNEGFVGWLKGQEVVVQKNTWVDDTWTIDPTQITKFDVHGVTPNGDDQTIAATLSFQATADGKGIDCEGVMVYQPTGDKLQFG